MSQTLLYWKDLLADACKLIDNLRVVLFKSRVEQEKLRTETEKLRAETKKVSARREGAS